MPELTIKELCFFVCGLASFAILFIGFFICVFTRKKIKEKLSVSPWQIFTVVAFVSAFVFHLPVYYMGTFMGGGIKAIRPVLMSLIQAARVFLLDGDFMGVLSSLDGTRESIMAVYCAYTTVLFAVCPFLTAKLLLSFFKNFFSQLQLVFARRSTYIMSELNEMSISLAKSIKNKKENKNAVIAFCNVKNAEDEKYFELFETAKRMGALILKKDVLEVKIGFKKKKTEIFLISENESENIEKTVALSDRWRGEIKAKLFVYASSAVSGHIIDSLDKDTIILSQNAKKNIAEDKQILDGIYKKGIKNIEIKNNFDIRRIDSISDFALKAVKESGVFDLCKKSEQKTISILIAGLGKFGKEIFKTALWYCQIAGVKLEINVIDCGVDKRGDNTNILESLRHEIPEIIAKNYPEAEGEDSYDIRFFSANCFEDSLDKLFIKERERLLKTQTVFVTLGSDDKNINAALEIRRQFDKLLGLSNQDETLDKIKKSRENDLPLINAVVFDDKKAKNMKKGVVNFKKDTPYHINFIGNLSEIYNYDNIIKNEEIEKEAFRYHIEWVETEKNLRNALKNCQDGKIIEKVCESFGVASVSKIKWADEGIADKVSFLKNELNKYYQFEYFRESSISKAVHKEMLQKEFSDIISCKNKEKDFLCQCEGCKARRKTEHMRWMAYMRVNGFVYGKTRCDRAKIHPNLIETEKLDFVTQLKD